MLTVNYNVARATAAVQFLVNDSYAASRYKKLRSAVARPFVLPFKEEKEVLNELVLIGRQSPLALEKLIAIAEFKRNVDDKTYMATLMAAQRRRVKDALFVEQTMAGVKYTHEERYEAERRIRTNWSNERAMLLEQETKKHEEKFGEPLPYETRREIIKLFWDRIDTLLVRLKKEAVEKSEQVRVAKKYKVEVDKHIPETEVARKLTAALEAAEKTKRNK
ncbi:hypothetical protein ACO0LG_08535 [Undibacterium sp. Ji42W]|uniref:hypothetical protein n=1 Tax=Undibacterium sp. Ji42W TaxID=3413039 RepID=UPI003BF3DA73